MMWDVRCGGYHSQPVSICSLSKSRLFVSLKALEKDDVPWLRGTKKGGKGLWEREIVCMLHATSFVRLTKVNKKNNANYVGPFSKAGLFFFLQCMNKNKKRSQSLIKNKGPTLLQFSDFVQPSTFFYTARSMSLFRTYRNQRVIIEQKNVKGLFHSHSLLYQLIISRH